MTNKTYFGHRGKNALVFCMYSSYPGRDCNVLSSIATPETLTSRNVIRMGEKTVQP